MTSETCELAALLSHQLPVKSHEFIKIVGKSSDNSSSSSSLLSSSPSDDLSNSNSDGSSCSCRHKRKCNKGPDVGRLCCEHIDTSLMPISQQHLHRRKRTKLDDTKLNFSPSLVVEQTSSMSDSVTWKVGGAPSRWGCVEQGPNATKLPQRQIVQLKQKQQEEKFKPIRGDKSIFIQDSIQEATKQNHNHYHQYYHYKSGHKRPLPSSLMNATVAPTKTTATSRATAATATTAKPATVSASVLNQSANNLIKRSKHRNENRRALGTRDENAPPIHNYHYNHHCHQQHHHHHHHNHQDCNDCEADRASDRLLLTRCWPSPLQTTGASLVGVGCRGDGQDEEADAKSWFCENQTTSALATPIQAPRQRRRADSTLKMLKFISSSRPAQVKSSSSSKASSTLSSLSPSSSSFTLSTSTTSLVYHIIVIVLLFLYKLPSGSGSQQVVLAAAPLLEQVHHRISSGNEPVISGRARAGSGLDDIRTRTSMTTQTTASPMMMTTTEPTRVKQQLIEIVNNGRINKRDYYYTDEDKQSVSFMNSRRATGQERAAASIGQSHPNHNDQWSSESAGDDNNIVVQPAVREFNANAPSHQHRHKRHLVASNFNFGDFGSAVATADGAGGSKGHRHQQQQQQVQKAGGSSANSIDCNKLAAFWAFLQASYPALSGQLFQWATQADGKQSDEQFLWSRSTQLARSIGHLLDDAERLVQAQHYSTEAKQRHHAGQQHQQAAAAAAWLSRVSSNPMYARLVQQWRTKHQHQLPQWVGGTSERHQQQVQQQQLPTATGSGGDELESKAGQSERSGSGEPMVDEQMVAAPSQQQEHVYGRLIHYPREIGNNDAGSNSMARTLDKLRLLNHHARQQQEQQQQQATSGGGSEAMSDRDIENNRIPLAIDSQMADGADWRKLDESAVDSARGNFVYGKVLLRPVQAGASDYDQRQERPNPLGTLRELASEQQRLLESGTGVGGGGGHKMAPQSRPIDGSQSQPMPSPAPASSSSDTFGRILISPPSNSDNIGLPKARQQSSNDNSNQQQQQHLYRLSSRQMGVDEDGGEVRRAGGLMNRASQVGHRLEAGGAFDDTSNNVGAVLASGGGTGADELASQQGGEQVAVNGEADDEFEGEFHSGPLKQVEVRQLRSLDHQLQQLDSGRRPLVELVTTTTTTASPKTSGADAAAETYQ